MHGRMDAAPPSDAPEDTNRDRDAREVTESNGRDGERGAVLIFFDCPLSANEAVTFRICSGVRAEVAC